jgi:nicotinate-nucleotide adenylyltransferase
VSREQVGVLGGTFDPVHVGHLKLAQAVRRTFAISRVLLVPCAIPPHKEPRQVTAVADRLAMLRLATPDAEDGLEVSTAEIERGGTSFTIDTLRTFRDGMHLDPLFILGMDSLLDIPTWRDHERLLAEFDLVVVDRTSSGIPPGLAPDVAGRVVPASCAPLAEGRGGRIFHLSMEPVPVSSRRIRDLAAAGTSLLGLVPPRVARYIQEQGLYRGG